VPDVVLTALAVCTTLVLVAVLLDFAIGGRRVRALENVAPGDVFPRVSIVVPARNEARSIEGALRSLLRLDYPEFEVIALDDRSTDATGAILDRLSRDDQRLRVEHIADLPEGWLGKNHAMAVGAAAASGAYVLFTDADVVFEPTTLRRAVSLMEREGIDHLAALPDVAVPGVALNAFVAAFGVFFLLYSRPWKASDPRSRHHIGIGAFNLIRSTVYRAIGTHQAIAMRPDDDMKLGKIVKKHGFKQDVVTARELMSVEWYQSLGEAVHGLMKNAFAGVGYSLAAVTVSTAAILVLYVWPFVGLVATRGLARTLNAVSVGIMVLLFALVSHGRPWRTAYVLAFPAAAMLFAYVVWRSALVAVVRGRVEWRGTEYPLSKMRANRV
jgi:hypothetical protein